MYRDPDITSENKDKGLVRWLGHVERMPEKKRTANKVFKNIPEGKKSAGKPRKRALELLKMIRRIWVLGAWRKIARNRVAQKLILKISRLLQGP